MDGHSTNNFRDTNDAALWPAQPVQLARGRQPRDALAKTIQYNVSSMDEFETSLREYLNSPPEQPEHTDAQLSFWIGTSFMVSVPSSSSNPPPSQQISPPPQPHLAQQHNAPPGYQPANGLPVQYGGPSHAYQSVSDPAIALTLTNYPQSSDSNDAGSHNGKKPEHKVSLSIMEALQPTADPKEKMRKQRAIAKCCVDSIQRIDGYRYSFHNCWNSREDDSFRFSYYCNDSLLNKDRAANGKGAKLGKRATKPVYDCKGVLAIKFSANKQTLDVIYKHVPIHKTYEERAPPPRKDSKRRKFLEVHDPDALSRIASRAKPLEEDIEDPETLKSKKKKLKPEVQKPSNTSLESDLRAQSLRSLLELIQVDPPAQPELTPPEPLPLPPPHHNHIITVPPPLQIQTPATQQRKRPRNSCDVCKAKKTKCDGTRPVCQTCIDKKRQCYYSEPTNGVEEQRQSTETGETVRQAQPANNELSELEKMKRELEEAKARIQELELEKRASTTPIQTPQMISRPQSQPKPQAQAQAQSQVHHRPQMSHSQTQSHVSQQRQQAPTQQHRQQLQQLNQGNQRAIGSPQQIAYKLDSPQQRLQGAQQLQSPQQQLQSAQQQLQAAAAQQMQPAQHAQLQTPQNYFTTTHPNHSPYGVLNRPLPQNGLPAQTSMTNQNAISNQNNAHLPQAQPQPQSQMHAPTAPTVDTNNPYGRADFAWPPAAYYGYQSAQQQQQQQDQWAAARGSGVFR